MRQRFTKVFMLGVALCFIGLGVLAGDKIILSNYGVANQPPRIPPAGHFIKAKAPFRFYLLGDSAGNDLAFDKIINTAKNDPQARFIIHTGDIARKNLYRHFEWLLNRINTQIGDFPFYIIPGNHEIAAGDTQAERLESYNHVFGPRYYWFGYANTLFIMLDSSISRIDYDQADWLEEILQRIRPMYKSCFVFMHVPPRDPRKGKTYCMSEPVSWFGKLLKKYNVNAIFSGHIHEYHASSFYDIPLYINPSSGQTIRSDDPFYGFLICDVDSDGKLSVQHCPATDKKARDYAGHFFSATYPKLRMHLVGFAMLLTGLVLLMFKRTT